MVKHIFKIFRCEHRKLLKYAWTFFRLMHERVSIVGNGEIVDYNQKGHLRLARFQKFQIE